MFIILDVKTVSMCPFLINMFDVFWKFNNCVHMCMWMR